MRRQCSLKKLVLCGLIGMGVHYYGLPAPQAQASEMPEYDLDAIIVEGSREGYYAGGYMSENARVGMMGSKSTMDTPYNITSVTSKVIEDFALSGNNEMMDVLAFSPSVRRTTSPDLVAIRGKQVSAQQMNINGINGLYSNFSTGLNFIERVDIVSGPALLYSGSSAQNVIGGTVGLQSKRAQDTPTANVSLKYTGKGNVQEALDFGQRFGKDKAWGVRVNAMNRSGNLAVYGEKLSQRNIFLNLDHRASDHATNFLAGYAYSKHYGGNTIFQPAANLRPNQIAYLPSPPHGSRNMNPSWAEKENRTWLFALNHEQRIAPHWSAFLNAGLMKSQTPVNVSGSAMAQTFGFTGTFDGTFRRPLTLSASANSRRYVGFGLKSEYDFGSMKNEFLIGVDKSYAINWTSPSVNLGTFMGNLYANNTWAAPNLPRLTTRRANRHTTNGFTIIDTMKFFDDRLILSGGLHHHEYQAESYNASGAISSRQSYTGSCPTFGTVYKFTPDVMVYANHSETFLGGMQVSTTAGYLNGGELLAPAKTKSNELGVKFRTGTMLNTLSFYQAIEPTGMAVNNVYGYHGETEYKGIELSTSGSIGPKWDVMGSLGYCRYIWKKDGRYPDGQTANGIPKWNANLAVVYKPDAQWSILGRMAYIGTSNIHFNTFTVPVNTRFDLGVKYKTVVDDTPLTLSAMCYNVTDAKSWYSADQGNQLLIGEPRTFVFSASFDL